MRLKEKKDFVEKESVGERRISGEEEGEKQKGTVRIDIGIRQGKGSDFSM